MNDTYTQKRKSGWQSSVTTPSHDNLKNYKTAYNWLHIVNYTWNNLNLYEKFTKNHDIINYYVLERRKILLSLA